MAIETPRYTVLKEDGRIELRRYESFITASVEIVATNYSSAANKAFSLLADYIFGNNTVKTTIAMTVPVDSKKLKSEKIAMTAPVNASKLDSQTYEISFTMPSAYTIENLPRPNNPTIKINITPSHEVAVIKFSGYTTEAKIEKMENELKKWAGQKNIKLIGDFTVSRYDPPWKPGIIRKNEISYNTTG